MMITPGASMPPRGTGAPACAGARLGRLLCKALCACPAPRVGVGAAAWHGRLATHGAPRGRRHASGATTPQRAPLYCCGRHVVVQGARVVDRALREVRAPFASRRRRHATTRRTSPRRMPVYAMCKRTAPRLAPCTATRSAMKSATLRQGEAMRSLLA